MRTRHKGEGKLKAVVGIGGIYCYCCTFGPKSVSKRLWNRLDQRRLSRELNKLKEVQDDE